MELLQDLFNDFIEFVDEISIMGGLVNMCLPEEKEEERELSDDELFELSIKNEPEYIKQCYREIREIHDRVKKSLKE